MHRNKKANPRHKTTTGRPTGASNTDRVALGDANSSGRLPSRPGQLLRLSPAPPPLDVHPGQETVSAIIANQASMSLVSLYSCTLLLEARGEERGVDSDTFASEGQAEITTIQTESAPGCTFFWEIRPFTPATFSTANWEPNAHRAARLTDREQTTVTSVRGRVRRYVPLCSTQHIFMLIEPQALLVNFYNAKQHVGRFLENG
ncbi:beta-lactamase repressor [Anopheles sinensis]|uniref:Beta-lactamase repressor n=1 Tax=Anopheles sinensis TaxID=74873 RepID=A0A084VXH1_ANOSI|nr:beta-lactamase repressor [Anopheles sinensis]